MFRILKTRLQQKHRTMAFPDGPRPDLPPRFAGRPIVSQSQCPADCEKCVAVCPTQAITLRADMPGPQIDMGRCLFCRACERVCENQTIRFGDDYRLAAADRNDLIVHPHSPDRVSAKNDLAAKLFNRSLKLRQVSAGGCGACEADSNVLGTLAWDMGRFGIQFVASPRHADGLLITGPVTENMRLALRKTYDAMPHPKVVIAVGACAISGGPYVDHPEQHGGAASVLPVDIFIPGCPPHPLTILDGLLRFIGKIQ